MVIELPSWFDRCAHDLRGPLSPVQTAVYLLRNGGGAEAEREELLTMIERQCAQMVGMIDELSFWSNLSSEPKAVPATQCTVFAAVEAARGAGQGTLVSIPDDLATASVRVEPRYLRYAFCELFALAAAADVAGDIHLYRDASDVVVDVPLSAGDAANRSTLLTRPRSGRALGLGLMNAAMIVERGGGSMQVVELAQGPHLQARLPVVV